MELKNLFPGLALKREQARFDIERLNLQKKALVMMEASPVFAQTKDPDEDKWSLMYSEGKLAATYTMDDLNTLRKQAQLLQYTCAGRNILQTMCDFIIGKKAEITPNDQDEAVAEYWEEWQAANKFDKRSKEIIWRCIRDGEVFIRKFQPKTGDKYPLIRFVNPSEIKPGSDGKPDWGIETDPEDVETPVSYHREYERDGQPASEDIPAAEMLHIKIMVDSDVKRGVSFFVGIAKYMKEYEKWLADRIEINKIRHIWNVVGKVEGGVSTTTVKGQFDDASRGADVTGGEPKKKVPRSGGVLLSKGVEWDLKSLNINASDTALDGRSIQLMVALGTNLPEYVVRGDASNANYASTMVSESPFVRAMESWQDLFEDPFTTIYEEAIKFGIQISAVPAKTKKTTVTFDKDKGADVTTEENSETDTTCTINFSTLLHRNLKEDSEAYQIHIQNRLVSRKTTQEQLGYNSDEENEQIAREDKEEEERLAKQEVPPLVVEPPGGDDEE